MSQSLPSVSLYIRITYTNGRRYERVNRRTPQIATGSDIYCIHFYENGKLKWQSVGTDLNAANAARMAKESALCLQSEETPVEAKSSPTGPKTLEELRVAFIHVHPRKSTSFRRIFANKDYS